MKPWIKHELRNDLEKTIHILAAANRKYIPYCGIMLTSVFANNPDADAYVLISEDPGRRNRKKLRKLERTFDTKIHLLPIDGNPFSHLPKKIWTVEMYYRILAPNVLPATIDRVLYLDCDAIVNGSLHDLWSIDLRERSCAAVLESDCYDPAAAHFERLNYDPGLGYFNSGVLLINLKYWREHNTQHQILDYLEKNRDVLKYPDQDGLNYVLKDSKLLVNPTYNLQSHALRKKLFDFMPAETKPEIERAKPVIAHATIKPWDIRSAVHPFYRLWHKYKRLSPYRFKPEIVLRTKSVRAIFRTFILYPLKKYGISSNYIDSCKTNADWL